MNSKGNRIAISGDAFCMYHRDTQLDEHGVCQECDDISMWHVVKEEEHTMLLNEQLPCPFEEVLGG